LKDAGETVPESPTKVGKKKLKAKKDAGKA